MNSDQIHGHLRVMKGWALQQVGRALNDPWKTIAGRREASLGQIEVSFAQSRRLAQDVPAFARGRR